MLGLIGCQKLAERVAQHLPNPVSGWDVGGLCNGAQFLHRDPPARVLAQVNDLPHAACWFCSSDPEALPAGTSCGLGERLGDTSVPSGPPEPAPTWRASLSPPPEPGEAESPTEPWGLLSMGVSKGL